MRPRSGSRWRQGLIDLVRDRRGEFAHRCQPSHSLQVRPGLSQRLLARLRSVTSIATPPKKRCAPRNRSHKGVDLRPDHAAILAQVALLAVLNVGLTGHLCCDDRLGGGPVVLMSDVYGRKVTELCLGIPGHSLKGGVRRDIALMQADHVDADEPPLP
jgi:hypothetical protein